MQGLSGESASADMAEFECLLLSPGPDVIVMDEAHRIKNASTSLSTALARVSTKRRILLTGTPLQNNLIEYFHMVDYVKPKFLGDVKRFKQLYEERIQMGQTRDGAAQADRRSQMNRRVWALSQKLDQLVQRRGCEILQECLACDACPIELMTRTYAWRCLRFSTCAFAVSCHRRRSCRVAWSL